MTTTLQRIEGPGDAELIAAVRAGDPDAYGRLFERHVEAARRLARQLVPGPDADDLVSEAFAKVLVVLQRGDGPDVAFRAYLLTAVRRLHVDRVRVGARLHTTDDLAPFDPGVPFRDTAVEGFESAAAARAFASLPERWQLVLWHTEVEGQKPAEIAPLLGMSANSVSALAYRAREGLRQAFLAMHAQEVEDDACAWTRRNLGGYVRAGLSRRDTGKVEAHLEDCRPCAGIYLELSEVNSDLAAILAPALLGGLAAAYVGSAGSGAAAGGATVLLGRVRDLVTAHAGVSAAAGATLATAVAAALLITLEAGEPPATARPRPPAAAAPTGEAEASPAPVTRARPGRDRPAERDGVAPRAGAPTAYDGSGTTAAADPTGSSTPGATGPAPGAGADPDAHQPPTTGDQDPGADPETDPPDPPDPPPPPPEPPLPHDLAVSMTATQQGEGASVLAVTVTGLPDGHTATLTLQGTGLSALVALDDGCDDAGKQGAGCAVGDTPATFGFLANAPSGGTVVATVTIDGEGTDTAPANNTATLTLD